MSVVPATLVHRLVARATGLRMHPRIDGAPREVGTARPGAFVLDRVCAVSRQFMRSGLAPGDRAAIMMPTGPDREYCHLGLLAAGASGVGVDAHDADENLRQILATVNPKALVTGTSNNSVGSPDSARTPMWQGSDAARRRTRSR